MAETSGKLERAMQLAEKAGYMLLATVDETGTPRLTPVEECRRAGGERAVIRARVDVPPLEDRGGRSRITLLLWDRTGCGYQLTGYAVRSQEAAVLDGLAEVEKKTHFPQVERSILMHVESIEDFRFGTAQDAGPPA